MATGKKYYWIKIKESFMTSDKVDFLMSQKNGANYIVLYQMLCLKTLNTDGKLAREIGELVIPFDEAKIQRDCKYFDIDTIKNALELFKGLGMICLDNDGLLKMADFTNIVGYETDFASQKRMQKAKRQKEPNPIVKKIDKQLYKYSNGKIKNVDEKRYGGNGGKCLESANFRCEVCGDTKDIVIHHNNGYSNELIDLFCLCKSCHGKVENGNIVIKHIINDGTGVERSVERSVDGEVEMFHIDIRDKILDIDNRYKNKDKDKELDIDSLNNNTNIYNNSKNEFKKPTLDEIQLYADSIKTEQPIDCERFYDHYESVGWCVGKAPMVDWKAMVRKWGKRQKSAKELEMEKSKLSKEEEQKKELTDEDIERIEKLRQRILEKQEKLKEEDDESIEDIRKSLKEKWKK